LKIYVSQRTVAMQLSCVGIFSNRFITNCPLNVQVRNFDKKPSCH